MKAISVIGAGSWGTALADLLAKNGYITKLWVHNKNLADTINKKRENTTYLPDIKLSDNIQVSASLEDAISGVKTVVMSVPSAYLRSISKQIKPFINKNTLLISATKGIENGALLRMSELLASELPAKIGVLSGPSFAREVAMNYPTAVTAASNDKIIAKRIQHIFNTAYFRVYTNNDVIGAELGGALKNIMAIATGVADGLGFGLNTRAALINRGLIEITRLGAAMGAKPITFLGLAGMGDLVLTCTGDLSRNRQVGLKIGQGMKLADILSDMKMVAEGVENTKSALALAHKYKVEAPIIEQVYALLFEDKSPRDAVGELLTRRIKGEFINII